MSRATPPLSADVIVAIKRYKETTGLSLKEAKDAIDQYRNGYSEIKEQEDMPNLSDAVITALRQGHKLEAVKLLRNETGMGLKEAKDAVEAYSYVPTAPYNQPKVSSIRMKWLIFCLCLTLFTCYYFFSLVR